MIAIEEILGWVPEKADQNLTTSKTFKRDVYEFFNKPEFKDRIAVEFGCFQGHSTVVLAHLFKHVYCFDNWDYAIEGAHKFLNSHGVMNVTIHKQDLYNGSPLTITAADVFLIDSKHNYVGLHADIERCLKLESMFKKYFILDDIGVCPPLKDCVNDFIGRNILRIERSIGTEINKPPIPLNMEGLICVEV